MLLNKHNLDVYKFSSKDESRYALRAILLTPNETVATDGHRIVRVGVPHIEESLFPSVENFTGNNIEGEVLIDSDVAKEIAGSIPKGKQTLPILSTAKIAEQNGCAKAVTTDLDLQHIVEGKKVSGQFPPRWKQTIPTTKPAFEITLDASYLAEIAAFAAKLSDSGSIRIRFFGADTGIRMDAEDKLNGQGMTAVLMPRRAEGELQYCDKW